MAVPYPITTTSLSWVLVDSIEMETELRPFNAISCLVYPEELITKIELGRGAVIENLPVLSVLVPIFVPFTKTVAPGKGSPEEERTVPVITVPCPNEEKEVNKNKITKNESCGRQFKNLLSFESL
ncbi:MAG: hypothetical protein NVS3B19_13380 [Ginsengibacter sp.]